MKIRPDADGKKNAEFLHGEFLHTLNGMGDEDLGDANVDTDVKNAVSVASTVYCFRQC